MTAAVKQHHDRRAGKEAVVDLDRVPLEVDERRSERGPENGIGECLPRCPHQERENRGAKHAEADRERTFALVLSLGYGPGHVGSPNRSGEGSPGCLLTNRSLRLATPAVRPEARLAIVNPSLTNVFFTNLSEVCTRSRHKRRSRDAVPLR